MQEFIILVLFVTALYFISIKIYRDFAPNKNGCSKGCGSCGAIDFNKYNQQIESELQKQSQY